MATASFLIVAGGGANRTGSGSNGGTLSGTYNITAPGSFAVVVGAGGTADPTIYNTFGDSALMGDLVDGFVAFATDLDARFTALEEA